MFGGGVPLLSVPYIRSLYVEPLRQEGLFLYRSAALCLWGFLVKTLARFTTEKTIKALGDASDKILLKLPAKAAEKLVALQVEAASYAGIHHPERAQKVF